METHMIISNSDNKNTNDIHTVAEEEDVIISEEESGWTAYFEDLSNCSSNGSFISRSSPSLVSDAAWTGNNSDTFIRRLNFKNLKSSNGHRKYSKDDDLEDTASSPVNSPKVSSLKQMEVNYSRIDDVASGSFLGKQNVSSNLSEYDRKEKNIVIDRNIEQLRKRGLCLVPMSTLMNYIR